VTIISVHQLKQQLTLGRDLAALASVRGDEF
jgi:hypothetical protein